MKTMFTLGIDDVFPDKANNGRPDTLDLNRPPAISEPSVSGPKFHYPSNRALNKRGSGHTPGSDGEAESRTPPWREMDGPSFYCSYLGFSPLSKPPTNLSVLQNPVRELYLKYRRTPASGRSASLKITQNGVLVVLYEDGAIKAELFFDFATVTFVEAAIFMTVKTSSERKPKALFVPVDESKPSVPEKNAFLIEKNFQFLVSASHPPLVVCVVRRPTGVKALDCHIFALGTVENALHITALIGSAQVPSPSPMRPGDDGRGRGSFEKGNRGKDVIRTEYGEYSVYRGHQGYEGPPTTNWQGGGPQAPPPAGRNGHTGQPPAGFSVQGGIVLTQDNFRSGPTPTTPDQYPGDFGAPANGYTRYEQQPPPVAYRNRPDLIMHENMENSVHDRSFRSVQGGGSDASGNIPASRNSGQRYSGGHENIMTPRMHEASPTGSRFPPGAAPILPSSRPPELTHQQQMHNHHIQQQHHQHQHIRSPVSPSSPRGFESGQISSASNLESRAEAGSEESTMQGRPVAKVPPHLKGIKVLPSDFRMVKLKHNTDKRSDVSDDSAGYDNNRDMMDKYKEMQEHERDSGYNGGLRSPPGNVPDRYHGMDDYGEKDFRQYRPESNNNISSNNNKNRNSVPDYGGDDVPIKQFGGPKSHSSYEMGHAASATSSTQQPPRTKDLEIANLFSNFQISGNTGANSNKGNRDLFRPSRDRSEFEAGLGYLP